MGQKAGSSGTIGIMRKDRLARSRLFPELALFETEQERRAVLKQFRWQMMRRRQFWLVVLTLSVSYSILMLAVLSVGRRIYPAVAPHVQSGLDCIFMMFTGAILGLALQLLWRKPCQRYLREQLVARNVPICIHCG